MKKAYQIGLFKTGPTPGLFYYFCTSQLRILQKTTVGFTGIWTRIIGVEDEHAWPLDYHHHGPLKSVFTLKMSSYTLPLKIVGR